MSKLTKALTAAAGNAGGDNLYVEDVFSTYLYIGNSTARNITNGIDLAGEGGLVWGKVRANGDHYLRDTERGGSEFLSSNLTSASSTVDTYPVGNGTAFNSDGFSIGPGGAVNGNGFNFASWSFRKAEKFFDVVTYTGNGTSTNNIAHNLGAVPAFVIIKRTDVSQEWVCAHVNLSNLQANYDLHLNDTGAASQQGYASFQWNDTSINVRKVTDTLANANASGGTYVAYLFASDAGGFGDDGDESIIKCGSVSYNGGATVDLGFEPQWVLVKTSDATGNWVINDNMRGMPNGSRGPRLDADTSNAEFANATVVYPTATGFIMPSGLYDPVNLIYIAIRRPMKTPESGTEVFSPNAVNVPAGTQITTGFPVDVAFATYRLGQGTRIETRLAGVSTITGSNTSKYLNAFSTAAENAAAGYLDGWNNIGHHQSVGYANAPDVYHSFKRATGFFDVVAYSGDGGGTRQIPHNLGAVPQLMITKARNSVELWRIGYTADQIFTNWGSTGYAWASNGNIYGDGTQWVDPTASYVTTRLNTSGRDYIQYLFGTLAGVSKVGSYTGNGTTQNIECGFSGGARFLMLWNRTNPTLTYVWDSERGIITGSPDPRLAINSTAAEVTSNDALNAYAGGFGVTSSTVANRSGDTYIFLAIA